MRFLLLLPLAIFYSLFTVWPLVEVIHLSLYKTNFMRTTFIGLQNYFFALSDPDFLRSMINSILYAMLLIPGQIFAALFISLSIYTMKKKWQDISRILFYLPVLSAGIIIAGSWKWIFHIQGPINWLLGNIGLIPIDWFAQGSTAIPVIAFIVIFSTFGGNVIILLAAILSIDKGILEAARIDGANSRQIKIHIIIPLIMPTIILIGLLSAINAFQIFENIYALAPQTYAATMTFFIYQQGFQFSKYGMASAEAVILLLIILSLSLIKNMSTKND